MRSKAESQADSERQLQGSVPVPAEASQDVRIPLAPLRGAAVSFPVTTKPDGSVNWEIFLPSRAQELPWRVGQRIKRVMDFMLAGALLILLLPVMISIGLLVLFTSGRPVLYTCEYVGHRGRRFRLFKFRTMVKNADALKPRLAHLNEVSGPAFKIRNDPRVTPLGRVLRRYSLDELPQLWNVLRGEMSLVGPRPPLPAEWEAFEPWHRGKLAVVPGITCYWQTEGRSDITDFDEWVALDLRYIRDWSLLTDVMILLRTIPAVIRGSGAY